jgi:LPS-assembly protein
LAALALAVEAPAQVNPLSAPAQGAAEQAAPIPAPFALPNPASLKPKEWVFSFLTQDVRKNAQGDSIKILDGHVQVEDNKMLIRADHMEYNEETQELNATGSVYFHGFEKNEQIWCDHVEYNRRTERGAFFNVRGESAPRIVVRRGVLSGTSPYHFEGQWAERLGTRYLLYNGWVTNCKIPEHGQPWWIMRGPKFDIIPRDRVKAYRSVFLLRKVPLFYAPYFYHSMAREPRRSGFLMPHFAPHTQRGVMVGVGYYWAINRSYDLTYQFLDYNSNAFAHHLDFRGNPRPGTDFDLIAYGVQDVGGDPRYKPPQTFSGATIYFLGRSDLGKGWRATALVNHVTSFRFRQEWSGSYSEAIGSEFHSTGLVGKSWSTYSFDTTVSRLENFQDKEDQADGYERNAVLIHKLPEAEFGSSDRRLFRNLPLWFSFYSAAGLLSRTEDLFDSTKTVRLGIFDTSQFTPRLSFSPHVTTAFHIGPIDLIPSAGFDETFYGESQAPNATLGAGFYQAVSQRMTRSSHDFSLDLILPPLARVYNRKTVFGDKLKHVIEPRVTYKYVTGIGSDPACRQAAEASPTLEGAGCSDFNHYIRFDEHDLLANTNELTLSLTNRIYAKRNGSVREILTWSLMQKRYFDPTFGGALVTGQPNIFAATSDLTAFAFLVGPRPYSPIVSIIRSNPIGGLGLNWQADYDPRSHAIVDSSFSVDYRWKLYYGSVANNQLHSDPILTPYVNQYSVRAGVGDQQHRGWNAGFEGAYDYSKLEPLHYTTQVTYNTNCCGFSMQWYRICIGQPHSVWAFSFSLANIGAFGSLKKNERWF